MERPLPVVGWQLRDASTIGAILHASPIPLLFFHAILRRRIFFRDFFFLVEGSRRASGGWAPFFLPGKRKKTCLIFWAPATVVCCAAHFTHTHTHTHTHKQSWERGFPAADSLFRWLGRLCGDHWPTPGWSTPSRRLRRRSSRRLSVLVTGRRWKFFAKKNGQQPAPITDAGAHGAALPAPLGPRTSLWWITE